MAKTKEIKYHLGLLDIISRFKKPKWSKLISKSSSLNGVKAFFKPFKTEFKIEFNHDIFRPKGKNIDIGQTHRNIEIKFLDSYYILESVFLGNQTSNKTSGTVHRIHTKGFSEKRKYYFRLVIPLEKEFKFHFNIEQTHFTTDLGYRSRSATQATIANELFEVCTINNSKKEFFLIIDSSVKQVHKEFAEKANAVKIGLGYLTGYYSGNQGYFFAYSSIVKKKPRHFRFVQFRNTIKSGYSPIYSNSYGYLHKSRLAKKYYKLLRTVSLKEFSLLCERIYFSQEFSSLLMLILESSVASLLFMPGGYAIALETLSDIIIGDLKLDLSPIKTKSLGKKIRKLFKEILLENSYSILPDDLKTLNIRIDQFNQTTNKSRLKAPFDLLKISLNEADLRMLEARNDFLHGRVPDITNSGKARTSERINKDLYYSSMRFYTLINILILKWIGFDNRVVNYPKIYESFTQIKTNEEPYRMV